MVSNPVYHFHAGGTPANLRGQENVKNLYHMWAESDQSIFFAENEQVAVADNFVATTTTVDATGSKEGGRGLILLTRSGR
jgi:hypothetical protein